MSFSSTSGAVKNNPTLNAPTEQLHQIVSQTLQQQKKLRETSSSFTEAVYQLASNFPKLNQAAKQFVSNNFHNPKLITPVLIYLNTHLLINNTRLRHQIANQKTPQTLIQQTIDQLFQRYNPQELVDILANHRTSPVFTAHPTNFNRPEASELILQHAHALSHPETLGTLAPQLWDNQGARPQKPSVHEEAEQFTNPFNNTFQAMHNIHGHFIQALQSKGYPDLLQKPLIEVGNWIGGDRDGNPNIDAKVLLEIVQTRSEDAFNFLQDLIKPSSSTETKPLVDLLEKAGHENALQHIRTKLNNTRLALTGKTQETNTTPRYQHVNELLDELNQLSTNHLTSPEQATVQTELTALKLTAQSIGFHGTTTDIRQNSAKNIQTVNVLLEKNGWPKNYYLSLQEHERVSFLTTILIETMPLTLPNPVLSSWETAKQDFITKLALNTLPKDQFSQTLCDELRKIPFNSSKLEPHITQLHPEAKKVEYPEYEKEIALIQAYKTIHEQFGPQALQNCITANTETLSNMLEVAILLKHAGLATTDNMAMNIVPLIETVDDLNNGPIILEGMLKNNWYGPALKNSGNIQQIMVGYSDSNRLDGSLSSSWAVYEASAKMQEIAEKYGVQLHFFHGRGGTEARGSGDSYSQEIRSTNGATLKTGMRQTEQGEEVLIKYGHPDIAESNLADMISSSLDTMSKGQDQHLALYAPTMTKLAEHARASYGELYNHPHLPDFFETCTPIRFASKSNAGSRPAKRPKDGQLNAKLDINELRAIPWVGAWYQAGFMTPAWFGTGTALNKFMSAQPDNQTNRASSSSFPKNRGAFNSAFRSRVQRYLDNAQGKTNAMSQPHHDNQPDSMNTNTLRTMYKEWPFFKTYVDRTASALEKSDLEVARHYVELSPNPEVRAVFNVIEKEHQLTLQQINLIRNQQSSESSSSINPNKQWTRSAQALQIALMDKHAALKSQPELQKQLEKPIVESMQAISSANRFG